MEADLSLYHHLDMRDLGRKVDGRHVLTYRMVAVRIRHLPADSALRQAMSDGPVLTTERVLLAHVWQAAARSKRPHPILRKARANRARPIDGARRRKLDDLRRRARRRRQRLRESHA